MEYKLDEKTRHAFEKGLAHIQMARTWKEQQDEEKRTHELKQAIKSFDTVVSRAPEFEKGWVELALAYFELHDYSLARFLLDKALSHKPRSVVALDTKGRVLEKMGQIREAARVYGRAHRLDPNAGFDKKQQQTLEQLIEHEDGVPKLLDTEVPLHQIKSTEFAWNGTAAHDATITLTHKRIICIGKKVPEHEPGLRPRLRVRRGPSKTDFDYREIPELHCTVPLNIIDSVHKVQFYARKSLHFWDRDENHLVLTDLPETDIESILSFLGEQNIETGEVKAKLCSLLLVMFVGSLLLSVALFL